jgi:hypothetical protein
MYDHEGRECQFHLLKIADVVGYRRPFGLRGGGSCGVRLEKRGQLRDAGVLTDDEFASKKADLLARV